MRDETKRALKRCFKYAPESARTRRAWRRVGKSGTGGRGVTASLAGVAKCRAQSNLCNLQQRVANLIEIESTLVSFALASLGLAWPTAILPPSPPLANTPHTLCPLLSAALGCRCMQLICATNEFICHLYAGNVGV